MDTWTVILIVVAVVLAIAYFARRSSRIRKEGQRGSQD
jgi:hypothetical protein